MQVVEHEHERRPLGELLQQRPDGAVHAMALGLRRLGGERRERGEHVREAGPRLGSELLEAVRRQPVHVLVERVDEHAERQVGLELGRRAREHQVPALVGGARELGQQPRLADPGLARDLERGEALPLEPGQRLLERPDLGGAPDERLRGERHAGASINERAGEIRGRIRALPR